MSDAHQDSPLFARLVRRPVTALMILLLFAVLGVVAYQRIPIMLMPDGITAPWMSVRVSWPDSSPEETLEKVTKPIEDAIRALKGVEKVTSTSGADQSQVGVSFSSTTDMDEAYNQLKDQLERVQSGLPEDASKPRIFRRNFDSEMPIVWFGILCEESVEDPYGLIEDVIQPRLEAVDGVAQVNVWGMVEESLRCFVRPESLRSHGLSLYEVVSALRRDNFTLPSGSIADGEREYLLRIDTSFKSLEEVRKYPISENVLLEDVADVEVVRSYRDYVNRVNGKNALSAAITKESDGNTVEICERALAALDLIEEDPRLAGVTFHVYFTQSEMIVGAIGNLQSSMSWGALFAVLVLYLFIRRVTLTLLLAMAIPVSLMAALVAVYFTGFTFNIISLAGFTLAIGMLVDNSVVVAENIERRRAEGASVMVAASSGAAQVSIAIILATLTTIVVFLPMVFMASDRNTRVFLGELAGPITWSLLASLFTALVFLPIATVYIGKRRMGRQAKRPDAAAPTETSRGYGADNRLLTAYRRGLSFSLNHRFGVTIFTLVLVAIGSIAGQNLEKDFGGDDGGDNRLRVGIELPKRFTIREASDVFQEIERFVLARKQEWRVENISAEFRRTGGRVNMWFEDGVTSDDRKELSKRLKDELPKMAGVRYKVGFEGEDGQSTIRVQLTGKESEVLAQLGEQVVRELEKLTDLTNVATDREEATDELRISVDRDRAQRFGVAPEVLQSIISWGVGGQRLPDYRGGAREIPMLVEYEDPDEGDLSYVKSLEVPVAGLGAVPLSAMTRFRFEPSFGEIRRSDGVTSLTVQAESLDQNTYRINRKVMETLSKFPFPDGYGYKDDSGRERFEEGMAEVMKGLLIGSLFVYLLMGMLFESAILPLSVLLAIPLAMVGAYLSLFLTKTPMDGTASLALILLAGVVVNNGIVLIDRISQLRQSGTDRREAVLSGCSQRVRPVLMTAFTTMFGLLPMAMPEIFASEKGGAISYESLAIATLGGLVVSTALTLFVVPLFYTLFDDLGRLGMQTIRLAVSRPLSVGYAASSLEDPTGRSS